MKLFLLSILSLHGWTYFSTRIFVTCHVVKEIQYKNLKNCPYSPQFTVCILKKYLQLCTAILEYIAGIHRYQKGNCLWKWHLLKVIWSFGKGSEIFRENSHLFDFHLKAYYVCIVIWKLFTWNLLSISRIWS